jgi:DNA-binding transcriptional LysR family regulator
MTSLASQGLRRPAETAPSVRLGILCTIGPYRIAAFLGWLKSRATRLRLAVTEGEGGDLLARLGAGGLDAVLIAQPGGFPDGFEARPLYRERFFAASPPGHRFREADAVTLREFDGEEYVDRLSCEYSDHIDALMRAHGVDVSVVFASDREEWVQTMIMAGAGVAALPEYSRILPGLELRPIVTPEISREISLVTRIGAASPPLAEFLFAAGSYNWER